jgi:DNA-binding transcriptional regulator YdaS (Cro superfamily)
MQNPLERAIEAVGSPGELAARLGLYRQIVDNWVRRGVPPARWPAIAQASGLPLQELAPDVQFAHDDAGNVIGVVTPIPSAGESN